MRRIARHRESSNYFRRLAMFLTTLAAVGVVCLANPAIGTTSGKTKSSRIPQAVSWPAVTHIVSRPAPALKNDQSAKNSLTVTRRALPVSQALTDGRVNNQPTNHDYGVGVIAPLSPRFSAYGQVNRQNSDDDDDTSGHIGIRMDF